MNTKINNSTEEDLEIVSAENTRSWSFIWRNIVFFFITYFLIESAYNLLMPFTINSIVYKQTLTFLAMSIIYLILIVLYKRKKITPFLSRKLNVNPKQWGLLNSLMLGLLLTLSVINFILAKYFSLETWAAYSVYSDILVIMGVVLIGIITSTQHKQP